MNLTSGENTIREFVLQMGDIKVSAGSGIFTCFGLGSCVGLFLHDRVHKIGGGAHIMFPDYHARTVIQAKSYYAEPAIEEVLKQMKEAGADLEKLRAKLVGGAQVMDAKLLDMGFQNTHAIRNALTRYKIYIAAADLGGYTSRTARFKIADGSLSVTSQTNTYII
ncbi:chemotaxis protein CheD [Rhodocytophaga rosea]|uniref:Probable chemoreceptor glutamine deamidase CheD n=1 Tax=Rhodocytophaga rosea TaxID=2704465 RepID=A0A6C0GI27_9BACT|nr:chemotaxis protein CheD [Rhodocytophaga rosea]QHT67721.1 chemotaxis protein CheD [Rhodocytophaga rosea]